MTTYLTCHHSMQSIMKLMQFHDNVQKLSCVLKCTGNSVTTTKHFYYTYSVMKRSN